MAARQKLFVGMQTLNALIKSAKKIILNFSMVEKQHSQTSATDAAQKNHCRFNNLVKLGKAIL